MNKLKVFNFPPTEREPFLIIINMVTLKSSIRESKGKSQAKY